VYQYSLTLSKKIIEGMGWQKGDNIKVGIADQNKLELVREQGDDVYGK